MNRELIRGLGFMLGLGMNKCDRCL